MAANTCTTAYCKGTPLKGRKRCQKCRIRDHRAKNPMLAAYNATKSSAKTRGVAFKLTLAEFTQWASPCQLLSQRGRTKDAWHVDRIDNSRGYEVGNLQVLTCSENSRKGALSKAISRDYQHRCQLLEMGFVDTVARLAPTARRIVTYDYQTRKGTIVKIDLTQDRNAVDPTCGF